MTPTELGQKKRRLWRACWRVMNDPTKSVKLARLARGVAGEYVAYSEILLSPDHDLIPTMMHECMHAAYPHWSETTVRRAEAFLMRTVSLRSKRIFLKRLVEFL